VKETGEARRLGTTQVTLLVAMAVFAQEFAWNFYDAQVPPLVREHVTSAALIGLLMGMDNFLGIFVQPWIGNRSDNTRTGWGRRMPYILVGLPLAAGLYLFLPLSAASLPVLVAVMFAYALVANTFKPIVESLMPDFMPENRRSRANAVVKIASALTVIVAAVLSVLVVDDHPTLAFAFPPLLMVLAAAVLAARMRDNHSPAYQAALREDESGEHRERPRVRVREIIVAIFRDRDRTRMRVLLAILLFGSAWAASRSLITTYGMENLDMSRGDAGGLSLPAGIAFIVAAYPAAVLAERFGAVRVMLAGIVVFSVCMAFGAVVPTYPGTMIALAGGAVGATGFMVNAVVVLWNLAPSARVLGTYTGLHTVGWAGGAFLGPALVGGMVDLTGWSFLLADIAVVAAVAALTLAPAAIRRR
jgi:MFS family permease